MRAYRWTLNLKLGLVLFAVLIAAASLFYTNRVVEQLRTREAYLISLWASALEELPRAQTASLNPYTDELRGLESLLEVSDVLPAPSRERYAQALRWAQSMPSSSEVNFITEQFLRPNLFRIPAIITDTLGTPITWRDVGLDSTLTSLSSLAALPPADSAAAMQHLTALLKRMDAIHTPIPVEVDFPGDPPQQLRQQLHYGESSLVQELQLFPFVQLAFVSLFVLLGYVSFSYVRRSEQKGLWAGMAKEAAHQLGTPLSSLMGWNELLSAEPMTPLQAEAVREIEGDIVRLRRVAARFSDIGSVPKLEPHRLATLVENTADYIRRRLPQLGKRVTLGVDVDPALRVMANPELFEWVIENLLKNALDAIEGTEGHIQVVGRAEEGWAVVDVTDNGKGIERRHFRNVFRPGYSSKKRGWGLGLSLARRIVEDYHGGRLRLHASRTGPDSGTTFRIQLKEI